MSYTPPIGDEAGFKLQGGYSTPAGDQAGFSLNDLALFEVAQAVDLDYFIAVEVVDGCELGYHVYGSYVIGAVVLDYAIMDGEVLTETDIDYHFFIQAETELTLPESADVLAATTIAWRNTWEIVRAVNIDWDERGEILAAVSLHWDAISEVLTETAITWNLEAQTPLLVAHDLIWSMPPAATLEPVAITWTYDGDAAFVSTDPVGGGGAGGSGTESGGNLGTGAASGVTGGVPTIGFSSIISASVLLTRQEYLYSATLTLASLAEYLSCPVGTAVSLTIAGESIVFRVSDRTRQRNEIDSTYTLALVSPAAWLDDPWAVAPAELAGGMASALGASLASPLSLTWDTADWLVDADLLPVMNRPPMQVLKQLAGTPGAIVRSELDGSLTVERAYPVPVTGWASATPDIYIDEAAEVFTATEDEDQRKIVNTVLISNSTGDQAAVTLQIEVIQSDTDPLEKTIRVYPVPWDAACTLRHTDGIPVTLRLDGIEIRTETETVEIVDGVGRTAWPIYSLISSRYMTANLGAIDWTEAGEITTATEAETLIEITYRTRCKTWTLTSRTGEAVQVVAERDELAGTSAGITIEVSRPPADSPGDDVFDQLITSVPVALERGRNIIDGASSRRALVRLETPAVALYRPGSLVEVRDMEIPAWRGLLIEQELRFAIGEDFGGLVAESFLEIEREIA